MRDQTEGQSNRQRARIEGMLLHEQARRRLYGPKWIPMYEHRSCHLGDSEGCARDQRRNEPFRLENSNAPVLLSHDPKT